MILERRLAILMNMLAIIRRWLAIALQYARNIQDYWRLKHA